MLHFFGPLCINLAQIYLLYIAVSLAELSNQSDFPPTKVLLFKLLSKLFHLSLKVFLTKENHEMHSKKRRNPNNLSYIHSDNHWKIIAINAGWSIFLRGEGENRQGRAKKRQSQVLKNFC